MCEQHGLTLTSWAARAADWSEGMRTAPAALGGVLLSTLPWGYVHILFLYPRAPHACEYHHFFLIFLCLGSVCPPASCLLPLEHTPGVHTCSPDVSPKMKQLQVKAPDIPWDTRAHAQHTHMHSNMHTHAHVHAHSHIHSHNSAHTCVIDCWTKTAPGHHSFP